MTKADIPTNISPDLKKLIEQTFSPDVHERVSAAKQIGKMHGREAADAVPFLMRLMDDSEAITAGYGYGYATKAIVAIGEPSLDACINAAKSGQSDAIFCLDNFKSSRAVDTLLELLQSPDKETRIDAIIALQGCTDTRATLPLIDIMEHGNLAMRAKAIWCFESLRDPRAVKPLLKILNDRNIWDRSLLGTTIRALGCQRDKRAVPVLLKILQNPKKEEWLRHAAAMSLGQISDSSVFPILAKTLLDRKESTVVRSGAALGIGLYRASVGELILDCHHYTRVLTLLTTVMNDEDEPLKLRSAAAEALGEFGQPAAVKALSSIAASHTHNELGFWAAISAVDLTDGAIRNVGVVRAIKNYRRHPEDASPIQPKHDALEKIKENGATLRVRLALRDLDWLVIAIPAACAIFAFVTVVVWFIMRCPGPAGLGNRTSGK